MPRRLVYPLRFGNSLPLPALWDRRPLPNLLHPQDPVTGNEERARIERWYRELKSGEKKTSQAETSIHAVPGLLECVL
ncbi:MAG TPA: hypothetical protein VK901_15920, partial [Nitrospiraceae bacterium]|nr:hypothetical protein [Nitrospiraceae bacterium]